MTATASGLSAITQIAMSVRDTDRAVRFYRDSLGMQLLFVAPPNLAFFNCGGIRLMLSPAEGPFEPPGSILYFTVEDIGATHRELADRGVAFTTEPHLIAKLPDREVWIADFEDTEGNTLALMSEPRI